MKRLTRIGLGVSAAWVIAFLVLLAALHPKAAAMGLNEWGDFLAGFSAPLALLWLVIGYFQQGEELRLNTEALRTQEEALRRQVEETHVLARNSERQAAAAESLAFLTKTEQEQQEMKERLEAEPKLIPAGGSVSGNRHGWHILNEGGDISDVGFQLRENLGRTHFKAPAIWKRGSKATLRINAEPAQIKYPFGFRLQYRDKFGNARTKHFEYVDPSQIREVGSDVDGCGEQVAAD